MDSQYSNELGSSSRLKKRTTSSWTHMIETLIKTPIRKLLLYVRGPDCTETFGMVAAGVASREQVVGVPEVEHS